MVNFKFQSLFSKYVNNKMKNTKDQIISSFIGSISFNKTNSSNDETDLNFSISSYSEESEEKQRLFFFCFFMICISCLVIKSNINLIKQMLNSPGHSTNISIVGQATNILWGTLYCLININITTIYGGQNLMLVLPTLLFLANYGWFEVRILIKIIEYQSSNDTTLTPLLLRQKISVFFCKLYILMFISMYFFTYFLSDIKFITLSTLLLWTPQIITNVIYQSRLSFPICHILLNSFIRIFFVIYFRGFKWNVFYFEPDYWLVCYCISLTILQILILYSQTLLGASWFIPFKFSSVNFKYLNANQLILKNRYKQDPTCIICLDNFIGSEELDNEIGNRDEVNSTRISDESQVNRYNVNKIDRDSILKKFLSEDLKSSLWKFHKYDFNINKENFVETECSHLFHTICLERWIIERRECPSCRSSSMIS